MRIEISLCIEITLKGITIFFSKLGTKVKDYLKKIPLFRGPYTPHIKELKVTSRLEMDLWPFKALSIINVAHSAKLFHVRTHYILFSQIPKIKMLNSD